MSEAGYDSLTAKIQKGLQSFRSNADAADCDDSALTSDRNTEDERRVHAQAQYQKMKSSFDNEKLAIKKQISAERPPSKMSKPEEPKKGNKEVISSIRELIDDYKRNSKALK